MKSLVVTLVASVASSFVTFAGLRSSGDSILRVERIEIAQAGKEAAMILEANEDGATLRMRAASADPSKRPWAIVLHAGLLSRPHLSFIDPVWGGAAQIEIGLDGEPGRPYVVVGHAKDPQFAVRAFSDDRPEAKYRSVIVRSSDGKTLLRD